MIVPIQRKRNYNVYNVVSPFFAVSEKIYIKKKNIHVDKLEGNRLGYRNNRGTIKFIKTRRGYRCNRWKMARRRGRFRRHSSPLPTGSFRSRMTSSKTFRENFCPLFIVARPRTSEPETKRADRGRSHSRSFLPCVQKNIFRQTPTTICKSCRDFLLERPLRPNFRRPN